MDALDIDETDYSVLGIVNYTPFMNDPHGAGIPATQENVVINVSETQVQLNWNAVTGATSYKIYSSNNSYSVFIEDTGGTFTDESWSAPIPDVKKFYYVKAIN